MAEAWSLEILAENMLMSLSVSLRLSVASPPGRFEPLDLAWGITVWIARRRLAASPEVRLPCQKPVGCPSFPAVAREDVPEAGYLPSLHNVPDFTHPQHRRPSPATYRAYRAVGALLAV
ncbi:hypothetical protein F5Y08DRAFT_128703 [Xylaria arbuscula]|nr:hypothetical protein F5Y08DRAFT_128703 [Xylaria arbuscula]